MNFCSGCGTKNRDRAKFCSRCGNVLESKTPPTPVAQNFPHDFEKKNMVNYEILPYEYENNYFGPPRIIDEAELRLKRARKIIQNYAIPAAGLVALPVPFSDIYFLLPLQCAMVISIGKVYEDDLKAQQAVLEIISACGFSVLGQITTLIVANFLPLGKLLSAPFVYGWTVGMGEAAIKYFESKGNIDYREIRRSYRNATHEGSKDYGWQKKMSREDSLENLKNYLTPEEYEKIKNRFYQ